MSDFRAAFLFVVLLGTPAAAEACPQTPHAPAEDGANLINDGSFTSGLSGWTQSGNLAYTIAMNQAYGSYSLPASGGYALLGPVGFDGTLSQSFADQAGRQLTISFILAGDGGNPNDFAASFDGHTLMAVSGAPAQGWTSYSFTVTATGLDTLSFSYRDDPGYWALSNISVSNAAAVSEPAAWASLGAGLLGLAAIRGRKPRRT